MKTNVEYFLTEKNQANPKFFGRFNKINFKDLKILYGSIVGIIQKLMD